MSAYFFFDVRHICDQQKLSEYRSQVFASVERFDGRYRVLGGSLERLEGDCAPNIPVLIEFPTADKARQWYESERYQPLKALRLEAAECRAVLLDGFEHTVAASQDE